MGLIFIFGGFRFCAYCKKAFELGGNRKKYCSTKCGSKGAMREWRNNHRPTLPERNCKLCQDEFQPTRSWQTFFCRDCMILYQNTYGRKKPEATEPLGVLVLDGPEVSIGSPEPGTRLDGDRADGVTA